MKSTNTVAKLFSSVSTLAVVAGAMACNGVAMGQAARVLSWGAGTTNTGSYPNFGQSIIPASATSGVTAIAGGDYHTIALKDGAVLAWGDNYYGQCLGTDSSGTPITTNADGNIPVKLNGVTLSGVSAIAGNAEHTIALKGGSVLAWGNNGNGQCTIPIAAQSGVTAIAGGEQHTIALKGGAVLAWGYNGNGQCTVPASASSGVSAIAGSGQHTIALKCGEVLAWGNNSKGECNIPVTAQSGVTAIAGGHYHTIALKDGAVLAWGWNEYGQCTIPIAAQSGVSAIAGGFEHTIALKDGEVLAWGWNLFGACNIPASANSGVTAIAGGYHHTIALKGPITTITGVLPISGPSSGGTNITITGTQFEAAATVTIGGAPATNVVVVSDTQITATTPAGFPGPAVVTVNLGSSTAFYYRPSCDGDLDNNGTIDSSDLGLLLINMGDCSSSLTTQQPQEPMIFPIEAAKPVAVKK